MGVKNLWKILEPTAQDVPLDNLAHKLLAVDASIWLYQFIKISPKKKSSRNGKTSSYINEDDTDDEETDLAFVQAPHVYGFFKRICKLLYWGITPVFVFDGPPPVLKLETLALRRHRKDNAALDAARTAHQILQTQIKLSILNSSTTSSSDTSVTSSTNTPLSLKLLKKATNSRDDYSLPRPSTDFTDPATLASQTTEDARLPWFSFESEASLSTPSEHQLLSQLRHEARRPSHQRLKSMLSQSKNALDFSKLQLQHLVQRNQITQQIHNLETKQKKSQRIASDRSREYRLVKNEENDPDFYSKLNNDVGLSEKKKAGWRFEPLNKSPIDFLSSSSSSLPSLSLHTPSKSSTSSSKEMNLPWIELSDESTSPTTPFFSFSQSTNTAHFPASSSNPPSFRSLYPSDNNVVPIEENEVEEDEFEIVPVLTLPASLRSLLPFMPESFPRVFSLGTDLFPLVVTWSMPELHQAYTQCQSKLSKLLNHKQPTDPNWRDQYESYVFWEEFLDHTLAYKESLDIFQEVDFSSLGQQNLFSVSHEPSFTSVSTSTHVNTPSASVNPLQSSWVDPVDMKFDGLDAVPTRQRRQGQQLILVGSEQDLEDVLDTSTSKDLTLYPSLNLHGASSVLGSITEATESISPTKFFNALPSDPPPSSPDANEKKYHIDSTVSDSPNKKSEFISQSIKEEEIDSMSFQSSKSIFSSSSIAAPTVSFKKEEEDNAMGGEIKQLKTESTETKSLAFEETMLKPLSLLPKVDVNLEEKLVETKHSHENVIQTKEEEEGEEEEEEEDEFEEVPLLTFPTSSPLPSISLQKSELPLSTSSKTSSLTETPPILSNLTVASLQVTPISEEKQLKPSSTPKSTIQISNESTSLVFAIPSSTLPNNSLESEKQSSSPTISTPLIKSSSTSHTNTNSTPLPDSLPKDTNLISTSTPDPDFLATNHNPTEDVNKLALKEQAQFELRAQLQQEQSELSNTYQLQSRDALSVTSSMIEDIQALLRYFGIPYIQAPSEAEAQCAFLSYTGVVDGVISDDNDVFLFGAHQVYRHFFHSSKSVELYKAAKIETQLGYNREQLINLAYLLGSDYTEGVTGLGPVTAQAMLKEFKSLEEIMKAHASASTLEATSSNSKKSSKKRSKKDPSSPTSSISPKIWSHLVFPSSFPDPRVSQAYFNPNVLSLHRSELQWTTPERNSLTQFLADMFQWSLKKVEPLVDHAFNNYQSRTKKHQNSLHFYYLPVTVDQETSGSTKLDTKLGKRKRGGDSSSGFNKRLEDDRIEDNREDLEIVEGRGF